MPAPSAKGRQRSTRPILEFLERGAQRKGKSIREITFEEFMNSPAMGFGGAGAIKSIRGVPGLRVQLPRNIPMEKDFPVAGTANREEILKTFDKQAIRAGNRANISRPNTIAGGERRANVGGRRPPDTELEALALNKQQAQRVRRQKMAKVEDVNLNKPGTLEPEVVEEIAKRDFGDVLTPSELMNEVVKRLKIINPVRATRAEAIQAELTGMKSRGLSGNRKEREQIKNLLAEFTRLLGE
ncbi:hypothetical protein LCGC14_3042150 [marine sediment metagenome]|uniref:Uncharacterized protein n=2 Tax=marine sediment metagenome TaxID=412755 RepID=A0A0F8ZF66_9ZZZZ